MTAVVEALNALIDTLMTDVGIQTAGRDVARGVRDTARVTLQAAQQIQDRFTEHDAALDGLNAVLSRAPDIEVVKLRKAVSNPSRSSCVTLASIERASPSVMIIYFPPQKEKEGMIIPLSSFSLPALFSSAPVLLLPVLLRSG